jgi:hypothetical protein
MNWEEYTEFVKNNRTDYENDTTIVLLLELSEEFTKLFGIAKDEIICDDFNAEGNNTKKIKQLGKVFWAISAMQDELRLQPFYYERFLDGNDVPLKNNQVNLFELSAMSLQNISSIQHGLLDTDLDEMYFHLNKLFPILFAIIMAWELEPQDILTTSVENNVKVDNGKPAFNDEYNQLIKDNKDKEKESIKMKSIDELISKHSDNIIIDFKNENRSNLCLFGDFGFKEFNTSNIIKSFFDLITFVKNTYPERKINYGEDLSNYLKNNQKTIISGYIIEGGDLVPAWSYGTGTHKKNKKTHTPILMTPEMKKVDELFDFISNV